MSSKRRADGHVAEQNQNKDDNKEEVRKTEPASKNVLKKRTVMKAKRRTDQPVDKEKLIFKSFPGLNATNPSCSSKTYQGFQCLTSHIPPDMQFMPLVQLSDEVTATTSTANPNRSMPKQSDDYDDENAHNAERSGAPKNDVKSPHFSRHLTALNTSVSRWIKEHINHNPLCDLTPVFDDYLKHLNDIEDRYDESADGSSQDTETSSEDSERDPHFVRSPADASMSTTSSSTFKMLDNESAVATSESSDPKESPTDESFKPTSFRAVPFRGFGVSNQATSTTTFFNRSVTDDSTSVTGFRVSSSKAVSTTQELVSKAVGVSHELVSKSVAATQELADESTSTTSFRRKYQPEEEPQEIFAEDEYDEEYVQRSSVGKARVREEGTFYTKKCKLFYWKDGSYADRGVGYLHLKPVPNSRRTQLIIRADTTLGHLLLNIVLNSILTIARNGKNNVVISCIPNPPVDDHKSEKIIPMLIRVKTSEDADELFALLNKKKNASY